MSNMKWLVIGGTGLLGAALLTYLSKKNHRLISLTNTRSIDIKNVTWIHLDLLQQFSAKEIINKYKPDVVVYTTGLTNVDECEKKQDEAMQLNALIPTEFAKSCYQTNIKFVYISTDHIFDGERSYYCEMDAALPLNVYARTKYQGELLVEKHCSDALILRTNFYGLGLPWRKSFTDLLWDKFTRGEKFSAFNDSYFNPIVLPSLVHCIETLVDIDAKGIHHLASSDRISKYNFVMRFVQLFNFDEKLVQSVSIKQANLAAERPIDMSLSTEKVSKLLHRKMPSIEEGLMNLRQFYKGR